MKTNVAFAALAAVFLGQAQLDRLAAARVLAIDGGEVQISMDSKCEPKEGGKACSKCVDNKYCQDNAVEGGCSSATGCCGSYPVGADPNTNQYACVSCWTCVTCPFEQCSATLAVRALGSNCTPGEMKNGKCEVKGYVRPDDPSDPNGPPGP